MKNSKASTSPLRKSDVLVIGAGIAGLSFALELCDMATVTVITKKTDSESATNYAQGGIACVVSSDDEFDLHVQDTLTAGAGLCHEDSVRTLVREGPGMVERLVTWGVQFSPNPQLSGGKNTTTGTMLAQFDLAQEGGHTRRRILHAKDLTGREIEQALLRAIKEHPQVALHEHQVAIDLIVVREGERKRCVGATAIDSLTGELTTYQAGVVLLSTGGLGCIYQHTTNPDIATGDGIAMAHRAGVPVANLEFVQFHPTAFYRSQDMADHGPAFLISEAVRGEGALLRRLDGKEFMSKYHPQGCLAPRDIVARAIDAEMKKRGDRHVWLDLRHLDSDFIKGRFPAITQRCLEFGVDVAKHPIPVVPAAHYSCGGVVTDMDGETCIEGLFATGETAFTGVHGANRLASNSLLEAVVYSHRAVLRIRGRLEAYRLRGEYLPERSIGHLVDENFEAVRVRHCREELGRLMWDYVGIVRSNERLLLAEERLALLTREVNVYLNRGLLSRELVELRNAVLVARLVVQCARSRGESRGLHYNIDYPDRDDKHWRIDTVVPGMD